LFIFFKVCLAAVGLVGDLCRALGQKMLPYCDEVMMMLLENLGVSTGLI
jgi:importin subunit beta-1